MAGRPEDDPLRRDVRIGPVFIIGRLSESMAFCAAAS